MMQRSASSTVRLAPPVKSARRQPLSAEQHLDALRRVQAQAEQRVSLGMQLFKAAEARVSQQRELLDHVKQELAGFRNQQEHVREQVQDDVTRTLHQYDQWIGRIDENFTKAMRGLEARMDQLEADAAGSRGKMESMLLRAEALLDQTRVMLQAAESAGAAPVTPTTDPTALPTPPKRVPPPARKSTAGQDDVTAAATPPDTSQVPAPADAASPQPPPADKPHPIYLQLLRRLRGDDANASDAADKAA